MVLNIHYIFQVSRTELKFMIMMAAGPLVAGGGREYPHIPLWLVGIARRIELAGGYREAK